MKRNEFSIEEVTGQMGPSGDGFRERWAHYILGLQNTICKRLEEKDGLAAFTDEQWARTGPEGQPEGGGRTRIMVNGAVFEKGGG